MLRKNPFLLIGTVIALTGLSVLSGCGGDEFGIVDPSLDLDGSPDATPSNDRTSTGGSGGDGGGGAGGTTGKGGASGSGGGASGRGGAGGSGGGDGAIDGPDMDNDAATHDGAPDTSDGRPGDVFLDAPRSDGDAGRPGDAADVNTADTPPSDAPPNADAKDATDAGDARSDSSVADGSADAVCSEPTTYYKDQDGDGFGRNSEFTLTCTPPGAQWSTLGGDCRDDLPYVKPYQSNWPDPPLYSGTGYAEPAKPQGVSFDYDCSGTEDADPGNPHGPDPNCGGLLDCKGVGYLPVNPSRTGVGIDPRCGSTTLKRCNGNILNCNALPPEATMIPYRCR